MTRMLCVVTSVPFPTDAGMRVRNGNLLRALAADTDVTVVTWAAPGEKVGTHLLGEHVDDAVVLPAYPRTPRLPDRIRRRTAMWGGGLPSHVQELLEARGLATGGDGVAALRDAIETRHAADPFRAVVLWDEAAAALPLPDLGVPVVVHRHNLFTRVIGDMAARRTIHGLFWRSLERRPWTAFDRAVNDTGDLVIAPSPEIAKGVRALSPGADVAEVPTAVDLSEHVHDPAAGRDLGFVGWMGYHPNVDAVQWFVRHCLSGVRAEHPETRLRVIGRDPSPSVRRLRSPAVDVTGEVPDVFDAARGVRVGVAPLWGGLGIKTKTLELMAMGIPVVATPVGAEGITARDDEGLLVARDATEFVRTIDELLTDDDRVRRLGQAARAHVAEHHSWAAARDRQREALASILQSVLEPPAHPATEVSS